MTTLELNEEYFAVHESCIQQLYASLSPIQKNGMDDENFTYKMNGYILGTKFALEGLRLAITGLKIAFVDLRLVFKGFELVFEDADLVIDDLKLALSSFSNHHTIMTNSFIYASKYFEYAHIHTSSTCFIEASKAFEILTYSILNSTLCGLGSLRQQITNVKEELSNLVLIALNFAQIPLPLESLHSHQLVL